MSTKRKSRRQRTKADQFTASPDGQRRRRLQARQGIEDHAERMAIGSGLPYKGRGRRSRIRDFFGRIKTTLIILKRRYIG